MRHFALYILFFSTLCFISSCSFGLGDNTTIVTNVTSDLDIALFQDLRVDNQYFLSITSVEANHCKESVLLTTVTEKLDVINLEIQGLETPSDCNVFGSKLQSNTHFYYFGNAMDFNITLARNIENNLEFRKKAGAIEIQTGELKGVNLRFEHLKTVKPTHFWGGLHSTKDEEKALFYQLYSLITENSNYYAIGPGNYGYFVNEEKTTSMHPDQLVSTETAFAIDFDAEFIFETSGISDLILDFRMSHPELDFFIINGSGKEF